MWVPLFPHGSTVKPTPHGGPFSCSAHEFCEGMLPMQALPSFSSACSCCGKQSHKDSAPTQLFQSMAVLQVHYKQLCESNATMPCDLSFTKACTKMRHQTIVSTPPELENGLWSGIQSAAPLNSMQEYLPAGCPYLKYVFSGLASGPLLQFKLNGSSH